MWRRHWKQQLVNLPAPNTYVDVFYGREQYERWCLDKTKTKTTEQRPLIEALQIGEHITDNDVTFGRNLLGVTKLLLLSPEDTYRSIQRLRHNQGH